MPQFKEVRDWATFGTSVIVPFILWSGAVMLKNQRLDMELSIRSSYVLRADFENEKEKLERANQAAFQKLGETNGKLDALGLQSATSTQILLDLKEEVRSLKTITGLSIDRK